MPEFKDKHEYFRWKAGKKREIKDKEIEDKKLRSENIPVYDEKTMFLTPELATEMIAREAGKLKKSVTMQWVRLLNMKRRKLPVC